MAGAAPGDPNTLILVQSLSQSDGNQTFADTGTLGLSVTPVALAGSGLPSHSTDQAKFGTSSIKFKSDILGTIAGYLSLTNDAAMNVGSGDWTFEHWLYIPSLGGTSNSLEYRFYTDAGLTKWVSVQHNPQSPSPDRTFVYVDDGAGGGTQMFPTVELPSDTWFHNALCNDGGTIRLYLDGVLKFSEAAPASINMSQSSRHEIGWSATAANTLTSYLDDFRFSDICRYPDGTSFTPPTRLSP